MVSTSESFLDHSSLHSLKRVLHPNLEFAQQGWSSWPACHGNYLSEARVTGVAVLTAFAAFWGPHTGPLASVVSSADELFPDL